MARHSDWHSVQQRRANHRTHLGSSTLRVGRAYASMRCSRLPVRSSRLPCAVLLPALCVLRLADGEFVAGRRGPQCGRPWCSAAWPTAPRYAKVASAIVRTSVAAFGSAKVQLGLLAPCPCVCPCSAPLARPRVLCHGGEGRPGASRAGCDLESFGSRPNTRFAANAAKPCTPMGARRNNRPRAKFAGGTGGTAAASRDGRARGARNL